MGLLKVKINSNMANKPKKWLTNSQWMSYTLSKIEKCYSVKAFMSYTIHRANEYFIISFFLSHLFILFILFSLSPALSLSLFFFCCDGCRLSLFSFFFGFFYCFFFGFFCCFFFFFFRSVMVMVLHVILL